MSAEDRTDDGHRLRVGVLLPTREAAINGDHGVAPLLDFAREAERLGYDSVWTGDSLLARPRLDPVVVLAAAAAVTSRVTLGTAAYTAALRHPLLGAHQLASLDRAAEGRLVAALGAGFPVPETEREFAAVGVPYTGRFGRLDDTVRLWRETWRGSAEAESGKGREPAGPHRPPSPSSPAGPPLWLAGSDTPRVLARTAERYDGWLPFLPDASGYARAWDRIGQLTAAQGRPPGAVTPGLYATVAIDPDRAAARKQLDAYAQAYYGRSLEQMATFQAFGYGSAQECAEWLGGYVLAGARHIILRIGSLDPAAQRAQLAEAARVLVPALRAGT
ncbi:LLM class flavin-dependent oxidoreductase [Streptomyces violens]|uniref:LLM class flavin-dependent oxidoreductase n=1 Tax=Streptomyces violens TaxID=66377 RepID=UPI0004C0929B|nr:LLM class flavin-dependent oxidoreductase [Streptomyces violens]